MKLAPQPDSPNHPSRTCGTCTVCCKTHGIVELNKLPNVLCPHVDKLCHNCAIYPTRPQTCRDFECLWLQGVQWLEESDKPEKSKVVWDVCDAPPGLQQQGIEQYLQCHELMPGASRKERVERLINFIIQTIPVIIHAADPPGSKQKQKRFRCNPEHSIIIQDFMAQQKMKFDVLHYNP